MQPKPRTTVRVVSLTLRLGEKVGEYLGRRLRYGFVARRHFADRAALVPQPVRGHAGLTDALSV